MLHSLKLKLISENDVIFDLSSPHTNTIHGKDRGPQHC